jgi:hypothetical protein
MNTRSQLVCAWSGFAFALFFMLGFWIVAGFVPPPSPNASGADIAAMYQANTWQIRLGLFLMMGSCGLVSPFVAALSIQMKRMEGKPAILTFTQLSSGTVGIIFLLLPCLLWTIAAFRPERDAELILLMNDMGWVVLLMPFTSFVVQNFAIGFAILGDKNTTPVFPRWIGFFTLWVGILFVPGGLLTFFKTGPFAWDGLFAFWVPLLVFFGWYLVMVVFLRKAILAQAQSGAG